MQMGFVLGLGLAVVVGLGLQFGAGIFSNNVNVLGLISVGVPVKLYFFHYQKFLANWIIM